MHWVRMCWLHVGIVLFLADKVVPLACETCHNLENQTCNGTLETCKPPYDKCGIALSTSLTEQTTVVKTCVASSHCETHPKVLNAGKKRMTVTKIFCCTDNQCKNISFSLPPINDTSNGKNCPACYYWGNGKCPERTVECSGEEIFCLELFGIGDTGRHTIPLTVKGCVNKEICDGFVKGPLWMGGVTIGGEGKCTPASRTGSPVPRWFGLILRVVMVLVLMKVLP